jgi:hypothetical protein
MIEAREHMSPGPSPSTIVVAAPLNLPTPKVPELLGAITVAGITRGRRLSRLLSVVGDVGGFLAIAYLFPLAILAVGIPIALGVRLLAWLVSWIAAAV